MMKSTVLAFFLLAVGQAFGQQVLIDSLRRAYTLENDPAKKLDLYYALAEEVKEKNLEAALPYADTLTALAKAGHNLEAEAKAAHLHANILYDKGLFSNAYPYYARALGLFRQAGNQAGVAQVYNSLGGLYKDNQQRDSAIFCYLKTADFYEQSGDKKKLASLYSNIGNLYVDQKLFDRGIELLLKALALRKESGDEKKIIYTYNNLAVAYGTKGDLQTAMGYAQQGVDLAEKQGNGYVAGVISGGIGHLLLEQKHYPEAIQWCERSIAYLKAANRRTNLVYPLVNLASVYNALKQPQKALQYAQEGYAIMQESQLSEPLEVYFEQMASSYEQMGNYKESLVWFKKFMTLDDSLFKADNVKNVAEIETKYQTKKKEAEIATQQLQIRDQESALFRQRTWIFGLLAGLLAFVVFGYGYYNRYRLRQKAALDAAVIREQQLGLNAVIEAQEAERRRIAKDLHDGIAQELVALKLGFNALKNQIGPVSTIGEDHLAELNRQLDSTCTEVRNMAHVMLPPALEQQGLAPSLELLLRNTMMSTGLKVEFDHHNLPEQLDDKVKIGVYRIAQELLNNIVKHAKASKIILQLYQTGSQLILLVQDDGQGFDFEAARKKGSMGLLNILSRVSILNGVYQSEKALPKGTLSTIRIPL